MKRIVFTMLLACIALVASEDNASIYKSGLLLPPQGDAIYKNECASCHGDNGKQTNFKGGTNITYAQIGGMDTNELAKIIKEYRGGIKSKDYQFPNKYGYGTLMKTITADLSWDEIDAVAAYINGLK